jgi:hypothetical protein
MKQRSNPACLKLGLRVAKLQSRKHCWLSDAVFPGGFLAHARGILSWPLRRSTPQDGRS